MTDDAPKRKPGRPRKARPAPLPAPEPVPPKHVPPEYLQVDSAPKGDGVGRRCKTCRMATEKRSALEKDWADGINYPILERKYNITQAAMRAHFGDRTGKPPCTSVSSGLIQARETSIDEYEFEIDDGTNLGDAIVDRVERLIDRAERMLDRVEDDEHASGRDMAAMITALKGCIELLAKLHGRLQTVEVHVESHPLFTALTEAILRSLCDPCLMKARDIIKKNVAG